MHKIAVVIALAALLGPVSAREAPPVLEAWCDGGIDGRFQHATVTPDGTIRASNKRQLERPWPEVGHNAEAAERWFAAVAAAEPDLPPGEKIPLPADGIDCGLVLNMGQEAVPYDLPEVLREIVVFVPGYH